ncbi:MAG: DedA family protein [Acidobacteriota bacterium]
MVTVVDCTREPCFVYTQGVLDFLLHFDVYLTQFVRDYGGLTYGILFAIIFAETGLVVTPFLPGDSLLFATGALAATGALSMEVLVPLLILAAVIGDAVNYAVGRRLARAMLHDAPGTAWIHRFVKREHVVRAHEFFERHGGKAVVLARFVPIVRTFVPFVAGGAYMTYRHFAFYNITGAILWVGICAGAGYLFGNIPVVKDNFELVVLGIIAVSLIPLAVEMVNAYRRPRHSQST